MSNSTEEPNNDVSSTEEVRAADEAVQQDSVGEEEIAESAEQAEATETEQDDQSEISEEELLRNELEKLQNENSELKNQYLRKQADFENFRKRMFREKEEARKYANSDLLLDLVTIIDDFERAIKSSEESKDFESFHAGIEMIEKQFTGMLEKKYGLKRLECVGEPFDPQKHEALMMEENDEYEVETVLEDFQKGFMLNERVLRPAKVKVSKVPASQE